MMIASLPYTGLAPELLQSVALLCWSGKAELASCAAAFRLLGLRCRFLEGVPVGLDGGSTG